MIKRTLYFGNGAFLKTENRNLVVSYPDGNAKRLPIEDVGIVILDHYQITFSHALLVRLLENNVAVICCNAKHMPVGMWLSLDGHHRQQEHFQTQVNVSDAVKGRLWKQVIAKKIKNQADLLGRNGIANENMVYWSKSVSNHDPDNFEARAAAYYWKNLFREHVIDFKRGRFEDPPNHFLNYGYTILRAVVARALIASGLLPSFGIHHHNSYNAYCLADDIMEAYRPFVDQLVLSLVEDEMNEMLTTEAKTVLLQIPVIDVMINGRVSPLMLAVQQTTSSLYKCYEGSEKKLKLPSFQFNTE